MVEAQFMPNPMILRRSTAAQSSQEFFFSELGRIDIIELFCAIFRIQKFRRCASGSTAGC